jgi:uncharacterized membrane protein YqjE
MRQPATIPHLLGTAANLLRRFLVIGENRLELLMVEVQEERAKLFLSMVLSFAAAAFGLLTMIGLSAVVVLLLRDYSLLVVVASLTALYAAVTTGIVIYLARLMKDGLPLSCTLDQLRKDFARWSPIEP